MRSGWWVTPFRFAPVWTRWRRRTRAGRALLVGLWLAATPARGEPGAQLEPRWSVAVDSVTGNRVEVVVADRRLYLDAFYHLVELGLATGQRLRRLPRGDCGGHLIDIRVHARAGVLLTLCAERGTEEGPRRDRGTTRASLRALDLASGELLWERAGAIAAPLATSGPRVVLLEHGRLFALEARSGQQTWRSEEIGESTTGPSADEASVVAQNSAGLVSAHAATTGKRLWRRSLPGEPRCAAALGPRQVYLTHNVETKGAEWVGRLWALDLTSGRPVWEKQLTNEAIYFPVTVGRDAVFLAATSNLDQPAGLYALSAATGKELWRHELVTDANGHDFTPTLRGDQLLLWSGSLQELKRAGVSSSYSLISVKVQSGELLWTYTPPQPEKVTLSRPQVIGETLVYHDGEQIRALRIPRSATKPAPP